ncbi:MAG: hypothetical protein ACI9LO_002816 [Planctomycetota bacterium]|jgi:hypothetical protein
MSFTLTLAEAETYLRKCARATGLSWGLAEEAGKASRWLAAFSMPGPEMVLAHLQNLQGKNYADFIPDSQAEPWQALGGTICPIIAGAAIADRSAQMREGKVFRLGKTAYPLLLAATIGQAARYHQTVFTTLWADVAVSCFENGFSIDGNIDDLLFTEAVSVTCQLGDLTTPQQLPKTTAYTLADSPWQAIDALAFKTYAPATAESRAGAGAGLTDND